MWPRSSGSCTSSFCKRRRSVDFCERGGGGGSSTYLLEDAEVGGILGLVIAICIVGGHSVGLQHGNGKVETATAGTLDRLLAGTKTTDGVHAASLTRVAGARESLAGNKSIGSLCRGSKRQRGENDGKNDGGELHVGMIDIKGSN